MSVRICTRCVMDETDASITFDDSGRCNYCSDVLRRKDAEYFPNAAGKERLDQIMEQIKAAGQGQKYDCMVGVSGGLDSSYVLYLGYRYGLRMLCVHIDDGLDTEIAKQNIAALCNQCGTALIMVRPDMAQYKDLLRALFLSGVPNLAMAQDNILLAALRDTAREYGVAYSLSGANFAMESILQRGTDFINASDKKHLLAIHKRFGRLGVDRLRFSTMFQNYIGKRYFSKTKTLYPLNYIDYDLNRTLDELNAFCGYTYYGGKHYESILTRFLQCCYLPVYFNFDKRKSHYSSLIMSGQMTRDEALAKLAKPAYTSEELLESDIAFLADYLDMSKAEFMETLELPKHKHSDYPRSALNSLAPLARRFRKWLG